MLDQDGNEIKCIQCKKIISGDRFWVIKRFEKQIPTFECPHCQTSYTLVRDIAKERITINKSCSCPLTITQIAIEKAIIKWGSKNYTYCEECFSKVFSNIVWTELGEDYK